MRIDADLLARVEPHQLVDMLAGRGEDSAPALRACRRALDRLRSADPAQRAGIVQAMAQSEEPQALAGLDLAEAAGWEPLWASGYRSAFHQRLTGHVAPVLALAFGTVGARTVLASAGEDRTIRVWDAWYGDERTVLTGHTDHVIALAFATDHAGSLASASRDGTFRVWNLGSGAATTITARNGLPRDLAFLPYQGRAALVTATAADRGGDGAVDLWDPLTGEHLRQIHDEGEIRGICVVPIDGRMLIAGIGHDYDGDYDSAVLLWDPETAAREAVLTWRTPHADLQGFGSVVVASTGPDRTLVGVGASIDRSGHDDRWSQTIVWWDARTHEEVLREELGWEERILAGTTVDGQGLIATLEYRRDERAGETRGPSVSVRPVGDWRRVDMQGHLGPVRVAAFSVAQSPTLLATAGDDDAVLLWDAETEHRHPAAVGPQGGHLAVGGDSTEPVLAVGTAFAYISVIDPRTAASHGSLHCSGSGGHSCGYGEDTWSAEHCGSSVAAATVGGRNVVASCGEGTQAVLWDPATGDVLRELDTPTHVLAFGEVNGRTVIATGGHRGSPTTVWDPSTGERIADLADGNWYADDAAWALDFGTVAGRTVLVTATADAVKLWDPLTGVHLSSLPGPDSDRPLPGWPPWAGRPKRGLAAGPDLLAFADYARVRVWDSARGEALSIVDELDGPVTCVSLIPFDGRCLLVVGTIGGTVTLWDASTAVRLSTLASYARPVTGVATAILDGQPHVFAQSDSGRLTACRLTGLWL